MKKQNKPKKLTPAQAEANAKRGRKLGEDMAAALNNAAAKEGWAGKPAPAA